MNSNENITLSLDQICNRITDGSHYSPKDIGYGYPMLSVKDMTDFGFDYSSCKRISKSEYIKLLETDCVPQINDVLVAKDGSFMKHVFVTKEFKEEAILSSIAIIRPNTKIINPFYLKYYFLNPSMIKTIKENYVSGSAVPRIVLKDFKKIQISFPIIDKQKAIANILSSLDDKIELNNKINKNLEEIAQTLYKRWFLDFEFPDENGKPYKSSGGEMVDSELGMIPKGWEVRDVNKLFEFKGGAQPPKEEHIYEHQKGYIRFIQNRDYRDGSNHLTYIKESSKNKLANKYDIMMDKYGEVGKIRYGLEGAYNVALAKIDPYDTLDREFLRGYFSQDNILQYLSNSSIASTRGSLNATTFTGLKVAYPNKHLKLIFKEIQKNTIDMILEKKSENVKLAKIRDELLPKLMSGEIEVPVEE